MTEEILKNLYVIPGDKLEASSWNKLVDAAVEAIKLTVSTNNTIDDLLRNQGRFDLLWTGNAYMAGTNIPLKNGISDYDFLMVQLHLQGTQFRIMTFEDGAIKSFREFNLADSATSTTTNLFEINVKKIDNLTLQVVNNKRQDWVNGATNWSTPTMNNSGIYVSKIWGVKF